jgi:hypothetical protein
MLRAYYARAIERSFFGRFGDDRYDASPVSGLCRRIRTAVVPDHKSGAICARACVCRASLYDWFGGEYRPLCNGPYGAAFFFEASGPCQRSLAASYKWKGTKLEGAGFRSTG